MKSRRNRIILCVSLCFLTFSVLACIAYFVEAFLGSSHGERSSARAFAPLRGRPNLLIEARIADGRWIRTTSIYPLTRQTVALRVKRIPHATIRWFTIRPETRTLYKNAHFPWEPHAYKWIGFAHLVYHRHELVGLRDRWEIRPFAAPDSTQMPGPPSTPISAGGLIAGLFCSEKRAVQDAGSYWFQVEVAHRGTYTRSYGIEDNDKRGLNPKVFRVSRRECPGYVGFLTSFFNVPGLFGSIPYQSRNYIGVDCADVLVAAYCKWQKVPCRKDHCVSGLVSTLPAVVNCVLRNGTPERPIRWGVDIHPGYFIAVKYSGEKRYQHIGALAKDANGNGLLDSDDLVLHAGPCPLSYTSLGQGKFDGHIAVLKPLRVQTTK